MIVIDVLTAIILVIVGLLIVTLINASVTGSLVNAVTVVGIVYVKPVGVPGVVVIALPLNDDESVKVVEPLVAII